uniref:TFIIS central domain-containing protein n=1 Tax=Gongylonema pulchrum TaxID=637853 RepID=A0A183EUS5_9BILA
LVFQEWKVLLESQTNGKPSVAAKAESKPKKTVPSNETNGNSSHLPQPVTSQKNSTPSTDSSSGPSAPPVKKQLNPDEIRNKCATMILDALLSRELPVGTLDPEDLAIRTEQKLFEVHRGTTDKYKSALRSRVFNLRDKKNLTLRENVLIGAVSPEK